MRIRALLGYGSLLLAAGCIPALRFKATAFHNDRGGYTLVSDADSVEKAMIRFQRTANDLCPGQFHHFSDPRLIIQATESTREGWQIDLTCSATASSPPSATSSTPRLDRPQANP